MNLLNYANPNTDVVPDFVQEIEDQIDRGKGPNALVRFFTIRLEALQYYRKSLERRYPLILENEPCFGCEQQTECRASVVWKMQLNRSSFSVGMTSVQREMTLVTFHPICNRCQQKWNRRPSIANKVILTMILLPFIILICMFLAKN